MQDLTTTLIQCSLAWEAPAENRGQLSRTIASLPQAGDLIVLPEMFTTGFSMNALENAEPPGGPTEEWMLELAAARDCALAGSIAVRVGAGVYNRLLFATPEGLHCYDKRHLFRMAGEHRRYLAGSERVVVPWRGWRINLQVCYDLRFPVFCRNRGDYDLMLFVANWPAARRYHWRSLLAARAIENQACVVGVNRVGRDAKGIEYSGDSLAFGADGAILTDMGDREAWEQLVLSRAALDSYREKFPCHLDADGFTLD